MNRVQPSEPTASRSPASAAGASAGRHWQAEFSAPPAARCARYYAAARRAAGPLPCPTWPGWRRRRRCQVRRGQLPRQAGCRGGGRLGAAAAATPTAVTSKAGVMRRQGGGHRRGERKIATARSAGAAISRSECPLVEYRAPPSRSRPPTPGLSGWRRWSSSRPPYPALGSRGRVQPTIAQRWQAASAPAPPQPARMGWVT